MKKRFIAAVLAFVLVLSLCPATVSAYDDMTASSDIVNFIKAYEGCSLKRYKDADGWSIGYGHYFSNYADCPAEITQEQADKYLREDIGRFEKSLNNFLKNYGVTLSQTQFDAVLSLVYNLGSGILTRTDEWLYQMLTHLDTTSDWFKVNSFVRWCHVSNGSGLAVMDTLVKRRIAEAKVFLYGDYSRDSSDWVFFRADANGGTAQTDIFAYKKGEAFGEFPAAKKSGTVFCGWQLSNGKYLSEYDTVTGDVSVKAGWSGSGFNDVPSGWYYDAAVWAVNAGVTKGTSKYCFAPLDKCTRGQIVTFLWRAAGSPEPNGSAAKFADVSSDAYYAKAVSWAVEKGITQGIGEGYFAPNNVCTRAQIVTFLWRYNGEPATEAEVSFTDVNEGGYYFDAVKWAVSNNITSGVENGLFAPGSACTRAEAVTFLYRDKMN